MSLWWWPRGLQRARAPCPPLPPRVCSDSCSLSCLHEILTDLCLEYLVWGLQVIVSCISGLRAWQPTSVFLSGESHGQRSLAGYSPWGCRESDTTKWLTLTQAWATSRALLTPMVMCQPLSPRIQLSTWKSTRPCTLAPVHSLLCSFPRVWSERLACQPQRWITSSAPRGETTEFLDATSYTPPESRRSHSPRQEAPGGEPVTQLGGSWGTARHGLCDPAARSEWVVVPQDGAPSKSVTNPRDSRQHQATSPNTAPSPVTPVGPAALWKVK